MKMANVRYRVIQEERSIYWEVLLPVIVRRKISYGHASNSNY